MNTTLQGHKCMLKDSEDDGEDKGINEAEVKAYTHGQ